MLSKSATYAIQSLAYLAVKGREREYVPISEIARELTIPYHFLKKILAQLTQQEILISQRSAKGGISLARDARLISLLDIIYLVDGESLFSSCLLGLPGCGNEVPCAMHNAWAIERSRLQQLFSATSLADIAKRIEIKGFRIS